MYQNLAPADATQAGAQSQPEYRGAKGEDRNPNACRTWRTTVQPHVAADTANRQKIRRIYPIGEREPLAKKLNEGDQTA